MPTTPFGFSASPLLFGTLGPSQTAWIHDLIYLRRERKRERERIIYECTNKPVEFEKYHVEVKTSRKVPIILDELIN